MGEIKLETGSERDTVRRAVPNKRRMRLAGLVAAVAVAASLVAWCLLPHEPSYQGRGLSAWLGDFEHDQLERRAMAADAVKHIGADAVPFLVERLRHNPRDSLLWRWKLQIAEWARKLLFNNVSSPRPPSNPRRQALAGLDALGPEAKNALPALEKLLTETPPDTRALYVVARIGPVGVPLLRKSLTNSVSREAKLLRLEARVCLEMIASHSQVLYPKTESVSDDCSFDRRICAFNLLVMSASFQDYQARHPEMSLPKGIFNKPPPSPP